jgi:D-alanyl-D-alanine carboxypeptidase
MSAAIVLFLFCCTTVLLGCATVPRADPRGAALETAITKAQQAGFAGEVLLGDLEGVRLARAVGPSSLQSGRAHRVGDVWRWASVSKQVTAALVMAQVDAGRVALDDTLEKHLPEVRGTAAALVTLRQLLQHTSGLPNPDDSPADAAGTPSFYVRTPPGGVVPFCAGPAKAPTGRFAYNNCDTLLLGALLERLSGLRFADLIAQRIAGPLKLRSLGLASGAIEGGMHIETFGAAGALQGTAADLLAFDRALLSRTLVSEASTRTMWEGTKALGFVALGAWSYAVPLAGCSSPAALVERRGEIGSVQVRNLIAPALGLALIVFTDAPQVDFGEPWQGSGLTYELASAAFCSSAPATAQR